MSNMQHYGWSDDTEHERRHYYPADGVIKDIGVNYVDDERKKTARYMTDGRDSRELKGDDAREIQAKMGFYIGGNCGHQSGTFTFEGKEFPSFKPRGSGHSSFVYGETFYKWDDTAPIVWCEGEKDADTARERLGCFGVAIHSGTYLDGILPQHVEACRDRDVLVVVDDDDSGMKFGEARARAILGIAKSIRLFNPGLFRDADGKWHHTGDGFDLTDLYEREHGFIKAAGKLGMHAGEAKAASNVLSMFNDAPYWVMQIKVKPGDGPRMIADMEHSLVGTKSNLYERGGKIVTPRMETLSSGYRKETKVGRATKITASTLTVEFASTAAHYLKWDERKQGYKRTDPPEKVAKALIERGGNYRLPKLAGVYTCQTMRPDGTVLDKPGYDRETRLYLMGLPRIPKIDENPSFEAGKKAMETLDALLDEPADGPSRSVALSGILTTICRGSMPVAPMHAVTAPTPGSGKSYLIDVPSYILNGMPAASMTAGWGKDELEKQLGTEMIAGQQMIVIDNLNDEFWKRHSLPDDRAPMVFDPHLRQER